MTAFLTHMIQQEFAKTERLYAKHLTAKKF
jgi:hypothetical protein